jgi:hypothetical protein
MNRKKGDGMIGDAIPSLPLIASHRDSLASWSFGLGLAFGEIAVHFHLWIMAYLHFVLCRLLMSTSQVAFFMVVWSVLK